MELEGASKYTPPIFVACMSTWQKSIQLSLIDSSRQLELSSLGKFN